VLRTRLYRGGNLEASDFDPARVSDYLAEPATVVWVGLDDGSTGSELARVADELGLNPLAVEDALHGRQRPKVDRYADHLFLSVHAVSFDEQTSSVSSTEIAVFASDRYLVTVPQGPDFPMRRVCEAWDASPDLAAYGVGFLLHGLLDVVVDGHFDTVQGLEDAMDDLEDLLFAEPPRPREVQRRSFALRRALVRLRRLVVPTREVVNGVMRRDLGVVGPELLPYYQDVYDHVLRAADGVDALRDLVTTVVDTSLNIQSNRMNEITKRVSGWAAIVAVPALVTGYYGINVRTWPHAGNALVGGIVALALMVGLGLLLYLGFRSRDWL
jgi:magnesium transporter